jgi:hypothetical protein
MLEPDRTLRLSNASIPHRRVASSDGHARGARRHRQRGSGNDQTEKRENQKERANHDKAKIIFRAGSFEASAPPRKRNKAMRFSSARVVPKPRGERLA